jgi:hypothetical protein
LNGKEAYSLKTTIKWNPISLYSYKPRDVRAIIKGFVKRKSELTDSIPQGYNATFDENAMKFTSKLKTF